MAALTRKAAVPSRLAVSCPGTASASSLWVQQPRWMPTDVPSLAISQSRPVAACWAARAAPVVTKVGDRQFSHLVHHDQGPAPAGRGSRVPSPHGALYLRGRPVQLLPDATQRLSGCRHGVGDPYRDASHR